MPRKYHYDLEIEELKTKIMEAEQKLEEYISSQRKRDTSIFIALITAVISAVVKALFAV